MEEYDILVIGGGPAGLAAAIAADKEGARVLLIEREERLGGILKQCIHDGFGLVRFGRMLTGPEYVERFIEEFENRKIACRIQAFVTSIHKEEQGFTVNVVDRTGVTEIRTRTVVLATGCRERTARQVFIHGTRPAGIFTAGTAQHFVNLLGEMVTKRCVILGSGDIGLIMARRLTLEGAKVLGVYEVKPEPSGLGRNIRQCLEDFQIPLFLSHTVTRVFGHERLEAVEVARVDDKMKPVPGTEKRIECDALILSVGLIPENEIAQQLGVTINPATKGPVCDNSFMTDVEGVFTCGNAMHVNDLVDYVSESGERAGKNAAHYTRRKRVYVALETDRSLLCLSPQRVDMEAGQPVVLWPRMKEFTCIVCPNGCRLHIEEADGGFRVTGNRCRRGEEFAVREMTAPARSVCSTVRTVYSQVPVLPVRTASPVPKEMIFRVMEEINKALITRPVGRGETVIPDVCGLGVDVIATSNILKGKGLT